MNLARNSLFNLGGALLPAMVSIVLVPFIVFRLGAESFGVLVLVTAIVGYFGVLDINAGVATIRHVSAYHAAGSNRAMGEVFGFGLLVYGVIGLVGSVSIYASAEWLVSGPFNIPEALQPAAARALRWAGLGFLVGQFQALLQSTLHGLQRYDLTAAFEATFGTVAPLSAIVVILAGGGLTEVVAVRVVVSAIQVLLLFVLLRRTMPSSSVHWPGAQTVRAMLGFSAYAYLSKLSMVAAANTDKLIIAALVDVRALALYAVPLTMVSRLYGMAARLPQVILPAASAMHIAERHKQLAGTYVEASRLYAFLTLTLCALLVAVAPELLRYWVGPAFGHEAVLILVCLAVAFFVDALTSVPAQVNDGMGRPRYTGTAAFLRALVGMIAAYAGVRLFGIVGAGYAQLAVSALATTLFIGYLHRVGMPAKLAVWSRAALLPMWVPGLGIPALAAWSLSRDPLSLAAALLLLVGVGSVLAIYGWRVVVWPERRAQVTRMLVTRFS